ncbi:MAG: acetyltransferase [Thomasclavelia sp.]|uniref:acetyltransferase n=1 Tax=Thomasclavelia sp. TaxID=3025757 RepID=UPI00399F1F7A
MKNVYIVGASGFGKEIAWVIDEIGDFNIVGFIDDNRLILGKKINGIPVIGNVDFLLDKTEQINVIVAIGNPIIRRKIIERLMHNKNIRFPNLIAKNVVISKHVEMGVGNIICSGTIMTTNIRLGNFNHINLSCTIGHDVCMQNFITIYPSVNVSGNVNIENNCELGTGTKIIQGISIINDTIVGAGSVVIKDIEESGTYVGIPVRKVK